MHKATFTAFATARTDADSGHRARAQRQAREQQIATLRIADTGRAPDDALRAPPRSRRLALRRSRLEHSCHGCPEGAGA